jgi:hypothetical protein
VSVRTNPPHPRISPAADRKRAERDGRGAGEGRRRDGVQAGGGVIMRKGRKGREGNGKQEDILR